MLEKTLEQLLLQYLDPYVEGISRDKLHLGVFSGSLELKDLKVKPDALALLGWEDFRVRQGTIKLIKLSIPWSKLYTGKLRAVVEQLHLEIESLSDTTNEGKDAVIKEMRDAKSKAIAVRMDQLREMVEEEDKGGEDASKKVGYGVKLCRKIINNITISFTDVRFSYINNQRGLACGIDFPEMAVLSTDQNFKEMGSEDVVDEGRSMYKLLRLRELGLRMAPAGSTDLQSASYVVSPISASLQLSHVPSWQVLHVRLEVATDHFAQVMLLRSQFKHLRKVQVELKQDTLRLHQLLVSPEDEQKICADVAQSKQEYNQLYERLLLQDWKLATANDKPLCEEDLHRLRLIEDTLSIRLLARERWVALRRVEALNEEVARRQSALEKEKAQELRAKAGFFGYFRSRPKPSEQPDINEQPLVIPEEERAQLLKDIDDESKVEHVDLPQRFLFEFVLGKLTLDFVDDRRVSGVQRQLLSLALNQANLNIDVNMATDYRGCDSAEWKMEMNMGAFEATHAEQDLFRLHVESNDPGSDVIETVASAASVTPGNMFFLEDSNSAAKLVIASKLEQEQNLLELGFDFAPVEVHFLPAVVELLLEFTRAPEAGGHLLEFENRELQMEEYAEMGKQFFEAHGDQAKQVAENIYERIPDKLMLRVGISSPIIHVPVPNLGMAMFSLGRLQIVTPAPCEYNIVNLDFELNHTAFRAVSLRNERFDMIQPLPVKLTVSYRGMETVNSVEVSVQADHLALSLAPQALQILIATPTAMAEVVNPPEIVERQISGPIPAAATTDLMAGEMPMRDFLDQVVGSEGKEILEKAANHLEEVRSKDFKLSLELTLPEVDVMLSDSIVPVMRLHMDLLPPGLVMKKQKEPNELRVDVPSGILEAEILNIRNGAWEPLTEQVHVGVHMMRTFTGEDCATKVEIAGHGPVFLNLTPTAVRTAGWILPLFAESCTAVTPSTAPVEVAKDGRSQSECKSNANIVKYRVINLCQEAILLEFNSRHKDDLTRKVEPTGDNWESLDEWVLPHFVTSLMMRMPSSEKVSEVLTLERSGAVSIPGSRYVAELLVPNPSHRVLLLASPLRIHNQTDLTLHLRFHSAHREVLPLKLESTSVCSASLLGRKQPEYTVKSKYEALEFSAGDQPVADGVLVVAPHGFASVPAEALIRVKRGADEELGSGKMKRSGTSGSESAGESWITSMSSHTWLSAKPACLNVDFCNVLQAGKREVAPSAVFCRDRSRSGMATHVQVGTADGVHLLCKSATYVHALPLPTVLTTIVLQPTLALLNALPIGNLTVAYASKAADMGKRHTEAHVPGFTRLNIYDFQGLRQEGICMAARIQDGAPYSSAVTFDREVFQEGGDAKEGADAMKSIQVRQTRSGAAACMVVEPLGDLEMRFSCPNWFVDRSGLGDLLGLELRNERCPLPSADGITLLPAECFDESSELILRQGRGPGAKDSAATTLRMPPSWCIFPWKTPNGSFVFCVQTEDVAPHSVLGAQCQVMIMRPRLVLTNSSSCNLELQLASDKDKRDAVKLLMAGESLEHHWPVQAGDSDASPCLLRFRPFRSPSCAWSGVVVCGDQAAGSTPFVLPTVKGEKRRDSVDVEVWTVEAAPTRGALAVSFRQGSDFVAINQAKQVTAQLAIRPAGCPPWVKDIKVPPGEEVAYGWPQPLEGERQWAVEVVVNGARYQVPDARRTWTGLLRTLGLQLNIVRVDTKTMISLEDWRDPTAIRTGPRRGEEALTRGPRTGQQAVSAGVSTTVELKLSTLGISVIEEGIRPRELLYLHLELIRMEWQRKSDLQSLKLAISEAQVDCQLPGRVDASSVDPRREETLGLVTAKEDKPAAILANCGEGDRAFLTMFVQRGATSSRDIYIPLMDVAFDSLDITIDNGWVDPVVGWFNDVMGEGKGGGITAEELAKMAGQPISVSYKPPPMPSVVQLDKLHISKLIMTVWCVLALKSARFLPQHLRSAIRVLSLSGNFSLDGAEIKLDERHLPPHRGSLNDFLRGLSSEYMVNLLKNAAALLGKSSILNLPRVPLKIGMTGLSYIADSIGLAGSEVGSIMNQLTMDEEYAARQRQIRAEKRIGGFTDGVVEAGKSLAQGLEGLADVWKKPVEGAKNGGVAGFFGGVGKGLVGGVFKPVAKVGQAISDVGSGIAAQVTPDTKSMKRRRARPRLRQPRLIYSELGIVRPWSELDAEVQRQVGPDIHGVEAIVQVRHANAQRQVMLLYPTRMVITNIEMPGEGQKQPERRPRHAPVAALTDGPSPPRTGSSSSSSTAARSSSSNNHLSDQQPFDFLDAIDESSGKLVSQILKPVNTVCYGLMDIERRFACSPQKQIQNGRAGNSNSRPRATLEYNFRELKSVDFTSAGVLKLEDLNGNISNLDLASTLWSDAARQELVDGFRRAASHQDHVTTWDGLLAALREEEKRIQRSPISGMAKPALHGGGAGQRILEVWEVERRDLVKAEWKTPSMPHDKDLQWRWVDSTGYKHPQLAKNLKRHEAAARKLPPCELDNNLFKPTSNWKVDIDQSTDKDGWKYGLAWNSSTWDAKPGLFDGMRRRRWTRTFS